MCCTVKDDAYEEPAGENAVHKVGDSCRSTSTLDVNHNENQQCATSIHAAGPYTTLNNSCNDYKSPCADESRKSSFEAPSSQVYYPVNDTPDVTFTHHVKCSTELKETCSDTGTSENASTDLTCYSQSSNITVCDSYCGTDSDLASQSQRMQLTNTQKVKMFALELDMMKVPVSAHNSQNSSFDSLADMSAMFMQ